MNTPDIPDGATLGSRITGHSKIYGRSAGEEKNYGYNVKLVSGEEAIYVWCNSDWTIIDKDKFSFIRSYNEEDLTWFYAQCGYIMAHVHINSERKTIYMHQLLTNHLFPGKGQLSVDHINRHKLDNRISNLRVVDQAEQNRNMGKRQRKHNARPLPPDLEGVELPKFVVYYKETLDRGTDKERTREFFRIEKHPLQTVRDKATTKSNKVSILDKLAEAKSYIADLERSTKAVKT